MSPLLASLALLALCWHPIVSWKAQSNNHLKLGSYMVKEFPQVKAMIKSSASGSKATPQQAIALLDLMPNTLLGVGLSQAGVLTKIKILDEPFGYGMMCELNDPKLPAKLNAIAGPSTAEDKQQMMSAFEIDCDQEPPTSLASAPKLSAASLQKLHTCFCKDDKGAYCAIYVIKLAIIDEYAAKNKPVPSSPCLDETVPALLHSGSGALGALWKDLEKFGPKSVADAVSGDVDAFSAEDKAEILCDAVNPDVEKAFNAVYSTNGAYWFAEMLMFAKAFPQQEEAVEGTMIDPCSEEAKRGNVYLQCICKQPTGFTFCIYKVVAEHFVNEGHLTCDKADKTKLIAARKPRSIPQLNQPGTGSGAATSSLTAASLAAAALLLLRE